ncbi:MAG TPA: glycosyltransferase [Rudaea sp.]|nr:glycosyltransferase [Rudaea sp.]
MRVLHVGKFYPPHPGGIERCSADLCAALSARGIATALLAHGEPGTHRVERRDHDGIEVTLAACHGLALHTPVSPGFPWLLQETIGRFKPDLLHLHVPNPAVFSALLIPAARRLPWVVHWHADIPLDTRKRSLRLAYRIYRPWEQALLRRAASVIATSQPYLDSSEALKPWRAKTTVIPLGIAPVPGAALDDTASRTDVPPSPQPSPASGRGGKSSPGGDSANAGSRPSADSPLTTAWPPGRLRILAVGRLSFFKGFDVLLRALVDVEDACLLLIGGGECREPLRQLASELGIDARVHFAGRIDMDAAGEAAIFAAYAGADIFCLPSTERAESFGLVLLEAMRARLPVIASAIPGSGVGFVVQDGHTGLMVAPGDARALAAALRRLAADAAERIRFGRAGAERWREHFTLDRVTDQVLGLYEALLAQHPVRAAATRAG